MEGVVTAMALAIVVLVMLLKSEWGKRHKAEAKLFEAEERLDALNKAQVIRQEARKDANDKISAVRSTNSDNERFDAIMRGMQNTSPFKS